jgi:hypothetical protein
MKSISLDTIKEISYSVTIPILFKMELFAGGAFNSDFPALFMVDFIKEREGKADIINTDAYVSQMSDENLYGFSFDKESWATVYNLDFKRLKEKYR